ncbi:MAG: ubiquinone biosynthesis regulatory protein kinase UbiB [Gammaproteobacteria bacterium]|nr:ubiquinone biosynthesis regulatory protein kinase UbiB [Gammaproteobacteria bacterium]MDD9960138.1 ubiquinone biosynthesis regulatory protein kinase UbiB [Gammaproteobacteria bacterium]
MPRLLIILRVIAKYRLDEFLADQPGVGWMRVLLFPFRIGTSSGSEKESRNFRLRKALEELGPIYIKFGQLLSTRRDFLDAELADELQSLQDNVPPFTSPDIQSIVDDSLGIEAKKVFKKLEEKPFASASVAQVHKAQLKTGEEVVVKVIRPGIEKTVKEDIKLLKWIAKLIESQSALGKRLRPIEVVNDYENIIFDELNLQTEAANTSLLRKNFENSSVLYVPKIYWDYTRKNILVMERIHGIPVTNIDELNKAKIDLKKLAETGVDIFFTQVFEHNFFHADMHPGNIFVSRENPNNPQYIAIDCAIIGSLSDDDQEYLAKNLLAIFKRDYRRVAELHVECGWVPKETRVPEFESAMRSVCEPIFEKPLKDISFGQLLAQLFRTAGRFNMEVQPSLVLLQKTLLNIEGLGRQLYPELDLWKTALPYLESWNSKRLNPFTLLEKIQENIPNWIEQLPHLPLLVINAIEQSGQLSSLNATLEAEQERQAEIKKSEKRGARIIGVTALVLAAATFIPGVQSLILDIPALTLGLTGLGLYLLCFKQ